MSDATEGKIGPPDVAQVPAWAERHYSPKELGEILGMSPISIIRLFRDEPGVLRFTAPRRRGVRTRTTYRIPESIAKTVYERNRVR